VTSWSREALFRLSLVAAEGALACLTRPFTVDHLRAARTLAYITLDPLLVRDPICV